MAITTRDAQVVNFIEDTQLLMTATQIARYFYKTSNSKSMDSVMVIARRRLSVLAKGHYLKRMRDFVGQEYIYYQAKKPPKKVDHKLLMAEFLTTMKENHINVKEIKLEYKDLQEKYKLRPDLRIVMDFNGLEVVAFVEVDRTKTFSNSDKYINLIKNYKTDETVRKALTSNFILISVCDKKPTMDNVFWVKTDMSNFGKFKFELMEIINAI